jgi:hypothetical protein
MIEIEPQTIPQSEDYTGVPAELARDWIARKFISVEHPADGRGTKNMLAIRGLYKIKLFDHLMKNHVVRKDAKQIAEAYSSYDAKKPFLHVFKTGHDLDIKWFKNIQKSTAGAGLLMVIDSKIITKSINIKVHPVTIKTK